MLEINGEIVNARVHNLKMGPSKILHARVQNLAWTHLQIVNACVHNFAVYLEHEINGDFFN